MISRDLLICCWCCCWCSSSSFQVALCMIIITVGVISSAIGTYSALSKIVGSLRHWSLRDNFNCEKTVWFMYFKFVLAYPFPNPNFGFCIAFLLGCFCISPGSLLITAERLCRFTIMMFLFVCLFLNKFLYLRPLFLCFVIWQPY